MSTTNQSFKVGKYSIRERLGAGGFGVVRKAVNEKDGSVVAIKILDKTELRLHEMTQNVKKEIALLTMLQHPNIVAGHEVLNSKTKLFLVMEYIDGGDMHSVLTARKRFPEAEARKYFHSLIDCLAYCHERGVYHRDLKLENLLVTKSGELKVCDFGLASVRSINSTRNELCRTVVGTEDFSPPEILKNIPYKGDKADIWSAGILLYTMIAGYCPFRGRTSHELMQKIISCKYAFPSSFPEQPKRLISTILIPDGRRRPSAQEILKHPWFEDQSPRSVQRKQSPQKQNRAASKHTVSKRGRQSMALRNLRASTAKAADEAPIRQSKSATQIRGSGTSSDTSRRSSPDVGTMSKVGEPHVFFKALGQANVPKFISLYQAMTDPIKGISVQDRKWRMKTFGRCFIGSEAVTWISDFLSCTRDVAIAMGQKLVDAGAFHHVCREHGLEDVFLFYRWHHDDSENGYVMNMLVSNSRNLNCRSADIVVHDLLNQMLSICKVHQQLNDYMEVDMVGIQQDSIYKRFQIAARELQNSPIPSGGADDVLVPFLVNLHNLLWIHSRIHIGDFEELDYTTLKSQADNFQYSLNGRLISLGEVTRALYKECDTANSEFDQDQAALRPKRTQSLTGARLARFFNKNNASSGSDICSEITPTLVDSLICFVTSDSSPESPLLKAYSRGAIPHTYLQTAAVQYLQSALQIDTEQCSISYSPVVEQFREIRNLSDDSDFIIILCELCRNNEIGDKLQEVIDISDEMGVPPVASLTRRVSLRYSATAFAPNLGLSL